MLQRTFKMPSQRLRACWRPAWVLVTLAITGGAMAAPRRLTTDEYLDKCKGAWAGQMIGVCYGAPYEFRSNGKPITEPLQPWAPARVHGAIGQDDCYVEMTFLKALADHGLDITDEQAGAAFAQTQYPLWHANRAGRENVRHGIMPPLSGNPKYNPHADDIDFQIEADLFGILCPGLPQESNRLCDRFGHIMNYGDGVYGGMFVAGMYTGAYFEQQDVPKVLDAGLACIPKASAYRQCIADVVRWHAEEPGDWLATWRKIEAKWQDDVDCSPGNPFNIDAKLNGAYIAMGLLYGEGDVLRTAEIATRCGQDTDCNASNAVGVLGCMKGYAALGESLTGGIPQIQDTPFSHTEYSFASLIPACLEITRQIVQRTGGRVEAGLLEIAAQAPQPAAPLEQWENQAAVLSCAIAPQEVAWWDEAWTVQTCGSDMNPGYRGNCFGRSDVLVLHPVSRDEPAILRATLKVPASTKPALDIQVASDTRGDFLLRVLADDTPLLERVVDTKGTWVGFTVGLSDYAGKSTDIRIENHADDWSFEAAYFDEIRLR